MKYWKNIKSISNIKYQYQDLLDEIKGFKYQITIKVLLRKYKENKDRTCSCLFNSSTKIASNSKYDLYKSLQEILYRNDN